MKNPRSWLRTVILVASILSVTSCTLTLSFCNPSNFYTLTWHPGVSGFPNVTLTLTPVIPPKALNDKPSSYVQVDLKVGGFDFSTNDPAYQCLETIATTTLPIILAPEDEVISGFAAINDFLIVYQACGQFVQTSPVNLASRGGMAEKELIFFKITGQKMVSRAANGQELTPAGPVGGQTPTPVPTIINFKASLTPDTVGCAQAPGSSKLLLDNTGSTVDVSWQISFEEQSFFQNDPWGTASLGSSTLPAGQSTEVTITPNNDLCRDPSQRTYHLDVHYTVNGVPQPVLVVSYMNSGG